MNAGHCVRDALVAAITKRRELQGISGLTGEAGASVLPQISVTISETGDWSTKTALGRDVRLLTSIRVARGQRQRLPTITNAIEVEGAALGGVLGAWSVASAQLVRTRTVDTVDGTITAQIEHRVRVLAI